MAQAHDKNPKDNRLPAVNLLRRKIAGLYKSEPNVAQELSEVENAGPHSKHQQFMHDLSTSGKSLAEIQTAWHDYYTGLPDAEKHEVWQEFYAANDRLKLYKTVGEPETNHSVVSGSFVEPSEQEIEETEAIKEGTTTTRSETDIRREVLKTSGRKPTAKQHLQSLIFGLATGSIVIVVLLFSFFNERFIAPFISPSRNVSSTPIIIDPSDSAVGPDSKIVIPKINVELPVIFDASAVDENAMQHDLESGVVHYPSTSNPGEQGNGAIFGHSSNNILNKGKYKFAFVLLKRLDPGDTFSIQYHSKRYVYKVYDKKIVKPEEVDVLNNTDKPATFTLITCDPPGTSINRLVVWGEQISPDPSGNVASTAKNTPAPKILPSNSVSLWQRLWNWLSR